MIPAIIGLVSSFISAKKQNKQEQPSITDVFAQEPQQVDFTKQSQTQPHTQFGQNQWQ